MPVNADKAFYDMLDSIAQTGEEDAIQQNKRIKEAEFAEDSREPNPQEVEAIRKELQDEKTTEKHGMQNIAQLQIELFLIWLRSTCVSRSSLRRLKGCWENGASNAAKLQYGPLLIRLRSILI